MVNISTDAIHILYTGADRDLPQARRSAPWPGTRQGRIADRVLGHPGPFYGHNFEPQSRRYLFGSYVDRLVMAHGSVLAPSFVSTDAIHSALRCVVVPRTWLRHSTDGDRWYDRDMARRQSTVDRRRRWEHRHLARGRCMRCGVRPLLSERACTRCLKRDRDRKQPRVGRAVLGRDQKLAQSWPR